MVSRRPSHLAICVIARRSFLAGLGASLFAAPAVVRASSLMQIRGVTLRDPVSLFVSLPEGFCVWDKIDLAQVRAEVNAILARVPVGGFVYATLDDGNSTYSREFCKGFGAFRNEHWAAESQLAFSTWSSSPPASIDHLRRALG